jgi:tetratricopeptide (TPR) repeat protein
LELRDGLPLIPFFIAGLWLGLQTAWLERHHVGANGAEWSFSFWERCLIAGRALWFYAGKLFWPVNLTFVYPRWQIDTGLAWQWLFPTAALASVAALWFARKRIGGGPLVAVLFFEGTLLPALGFLNVYPMRFSFVADHYQYLASIGLIVLVAEGLASTLGRLEKGVPFLKPLLCGLILLTLGTLTWRQSGIFTDLETLWRATIKQNPGCWLAYNSLGIVFRSKGRMDEAIAYYEKALEIQPLYAKAHNNLANALLQKGRADGAVVHYQKALEMEPQNATICMNLAWVLATWPEASVRNGTKAVEFAERASQLSGRTDPKCTAVLAAAYAEVGRYAEAVATAQQALQLAVAQNDAALVDLLQTQIKLYQAGSPFRDFSLTNAASHPE